MTVEKPKIILQSQLQNENLHCASHHGPGLSVEKRMVTLSPTWPKDTVSRRTGFSKL